MKEGEGSGLLQNVAAIFLCRCAHAAKKGHALACLCESMQATTLFPRPQSILCCIMSIEAEQLWTNVPIEGRAVHHHLNQTSKQVSPLLFLAVGNTVIFLFSSGLDESTLWASS